MFYHYRQNNSGGGFVTGNGLTENVIIEADTYIEANSIAEQIGMYFDGVSEDRDCECCGDRWYAQWDESEAAVSPTIYGQDVSSGVYYSLYSAWTNPSGYIHYKDGRVESVEYRKENENDNT